MAPKSLMELATMACIKNIKEVGSIGFLSYEIVRDILLKVDSAHQLRQIELNSPQIQGQTSEIWLKIIEREFPLEYKANLYKPQDPRKWYRVWEKYKKEHDDALEESENKLKRALAGLRENKEKNTSKIVGGKSLPSVGRIGPRRHWGPRETSSSVLTFGLGSRTKTSNGASVMRKVRREVKEIATIHGSLSRPIKAPSRPVGVRKAPEAMVNDYRRATQPVYRPIPKEPVQLSAIEEHEQRATFISDSEEEDIDGDTDPLEKPTSRPQPSSTSDAVKVQPLTKPSGRVTQKAPTSSLLRKFGPSTKSPTKKPASATVPTTSQPTVKKMPGILSNKPRHPVSKPRDKESSPGTPIKASSSKFSEKPAEVSNPPPDFTEGNSSPQSVEEFQESIDEAQQQAISVTAPRKRKAVDIFMRPKRRGM